MKIVNYIPTASFFVGGGERVPLEQTKYLKKLGAEISLITLKTKKETDIFQNFRKENPDIPIRFLNPTLLINNFERVPLTHEFCHKIYLALTREASFIMSEGDYDVAITHYAPAAFSVPKNIPQILFLHGVPKKYQSINETALYSADSLIAVSNSVRDGWKKLFNYKNHIELIHNGIDTAKFSFTNVQKADIDVLYVGRLIEIKGVQDLIKSIKIVRKNDKNLLKSVHIIGIGSYKNELENLVKALNLESIVHFNGYVNDANLLDFYKRSKICVFPSYSKEGVLTTLLEASSLGKAVITANCCGMADLVKNKFNGLLFPPRDTKQLAKEIEILLKNENYRRKLGKNAREEIIKNWSWERSAQKTLTHITKIYEEK